MKPNSLETLIDIPQQWLERRIEDPTMKIIATGLFRFAKQIVRSRAHRTMHSSIQQKR